MAVNYCSIRFITLTLVFVNLIVLFIFETKLIKKIGILKPLLRKIIMNIFSKIKTVAKF